MSSPGRAFSPRVILWAAVLAPAVVFYALLIKGYVNIPNADDYPAILSFANQYVQMHGFIPKTVHIITFQQSEYKTMLVSGITAVECESLHRISLPILMVLGNLMPIGIFFTVLSMYRQKDSELYTSVISLLPVSLLLFQLQYGSTLDWATASMQNLPVILCGLLAIRFLAKSSSSRDFALACLWLVVAICSSANGFGLSIVGGILLIEQRRLRQLLVWAITVLAMGGVYFYRYNFHSSQSVPGGTVGRAFLHFNFLYAVSFLGTSAAGATSYLPSVALGFVVICLFIFVCSTGYSRRNAGVFYAMVFAVVSAFGVAGLRGALGVTQSLASRYRIYSNLMLALLFIYLVESVLPLLQWRAKTEKLTLAGVTFFCLLFCVGSDWAGLRFIEGRKQALVADMNHWEHPAGSLDSSPHSTNPALERQRRLGIYKPNTPILVESMRLHLYLPPQF
jgi:hypothetical protein